MQVAILISATFNAAGDEDSCRSSRAPIRRAAYRGVGVADGVRAGKTAAERALTESIPSRPPLTVLGRLVPERH